MKIALLTDSFTMGGGLEYIFQVARGLPAHEFVICARGGPDAHRLAGLPNTIIDDTGYGPSTVARHAVDLIHINHLRPLVAHGLTPSRSAPLLQTVHGIHLRRYDFIRGLRGRVAAALRTRLERHCLRHVALNIALTHSDRTYLVERLGAKHVEVIPNGIEIPEGPPETRATPGLRHGQPGVHFLVVARFDFQKGHDVLLNAINAIQTEARAGGFRFDLLGAGPVRPAIEAQVWRSGIGDLVHFHGQSDQVEKYLSETDCLILPSRWEGLPFVLLEAGKAGRDVICSDTSGNRDVADAGRYATLFRNEDATDLAAKLLAYRDGQGRGLGAELHQRVRNHYAQSAMLQRLEAVYREVKT